MSRHTPVPDAVIESLKARIGSAFREARVVNGQSRLTIDRSAIVDTLRFLKTNAEHPFEQLSDIGGADLSKLPDYDETGSERFLVWYVLNSMAHRRQVVLRVLVPESDPTIDTALPVYKAAVWTEREVWEMFGVVFKGHPDLRRLLTPDYFSENEQYPLRKDYPLRGQGDRYNFPIYDPQEELDLSRFGYPGTEQ